MKDSKKGKKIIYVKYPLCLSCLFSPTEGRFIAHMINAEFLKSSGFDTDWSRKEWMRRMGLTEYSFDNAVKSLMEIGLLAKENNDLGNKVYYSFDMEQYNKLVSILSVTHNIGKLIDFCEIKFKKEKRTITSITSEEIAELGKASGSGLKKKLNSM